MGVLRRAWPVSHEKTCTEKKRSFLGLFLPVAVQPLITDLWDIVPIALRVSIVLTIQATLTSDAVSFVPDSTRSLGAQGGHAFAMPLSCLYYTKLHQATLTEHPFHLFLDHSDSLLVEFNYDLPLEVGTIRPTTISLPITGPSHCWIHSPQGPSFFSTMSIPLGFSSLCCQSNTGLS